MTITSMQFGQSAINVVLNEGQMPAKLSTDASGNTVLVGADGSMAVNDAGLLGADSSASAAVNTAAIQAALDAGGLVTLSTPGTYLLSATLTIYSDTHLKLAPGVVMKMQDSAGGLPVIKNNAYSIRATAAEITLSWSSGITANISGWVGHGLIVTDYVWMQGATLSVYNTIARVTASDSAAGTATVELLYVPSGAVSGTITALKCDRNITIEGGGIDYNYPSNTVGASTTLNSCSMQLGCIQSLKVSGFQISNAQKFAIMMGAVRDYEISGISIPYSYSDSVHVYGPAINGRIHNVYGVCGDDGIILQPREAAAYPNFIWTNGDIINAEINGTNLSGELSGAGQVQLYPSNTEKMIGIKCFNIGGVTNNGGGVQVMAHISSTDTIEDLEISGVSTYGYYGVRVDRASTNAAIVKKLRVRSLQENSVSTSTIPFFVAAACSVSDGEVEVAINDTAFTGGQYAAILNGTYQRMKIGGSIAGGSTARGVQLGGDAKTGNLIMSMSQSTGDQLVGGALSGTITLDGCTTSIANVVSASSVSGTVNVSLQGNLFTNASGGVVRSTTGTFNVRSAGNNNFAGTSVPVLAPSGTPTFNLYGNDLRQDLTATGTTKATSGQFCFNTAASAGTITQNRLVTCNGTAWVQVDDSAKVY